MKVGEQDGLMATTLQCVLQMPQYICKDQRFDVLVLVRNMNHQALLQSDFTVLYSANLISHKETIQMQMCLEVLLIIHHN